MSALSFPSGFTAVARHDCPRCTEAVRIVGTCPSLSGQEMNDLERRTANYIVSDAPGGLVYVSRRHSVRFGYVASSNCEVVLPSIRGSTGLEATEFRTIADSIYAALYGACLNARPQDRIVDFDLDALLALPIWTWAPDSLGRFGPLAMLPGDPAALAATLLAGSATDGAALSRLDQSAVVALPGKFLGQIKALIK